MKQKLKEIGEKNNSIEDRGHPIMLKWSPWRRKIKQNGTNT
jgi:hypothetical protein